ncbi:MAG TPA: hypothetical protein VGC13_19765 [Longimicrobium sp.]|jgi:chromosome segregation ATPase|uniref:hypothetical protein n=1 Tax=Longimicrobium sp. TaxID=2029185 RepID=UPI002ED849D8
MLNLNKSVEVPMSDEFALDHQFRLVRRRAFLLLSMVSLASLAVFGWIYQRTETLTFQHQLSEHRLIISELEREGEALERHSSQLALEIQRLAYMRSALDSVNQGQRVELSAVRDSALAITAALQGRNERIQILLARIREDSVSIFGLQSDTVQLHSTVRQLGTTLQDLEIAQSALTSERNGLQQQVEGLRARAEGAEARATQLEQDTATFRGRVGELEDSLRTRNAELTGTRARLSTLERDTARLGELLRQRPTVEASGSGPTERDTTPIDRQRRRR